MAKEPSQQNNDTGSSQDSIIIPKVSNELSKVATNPKKSFLILVGICAVLGYFAFNMFFRGNAPSKEEAKPQIPTEVTKPAEQLAVSDVPPIPQLPDPPKLIEPNLPPPPPLKPSIPVVQERAVVDVPSTNNMPVANQLPNAALLQDGADEDLVKKRAETKRKSAIMLIAGKPITKTQAQVDEENHFQNRADMGLVLGKGKIIHAVLETAVNTDLAGEIRAVVSRDVFAEDGKAILVSKGSRVFGVYGISAGEGGNTGRISIAWNRINLSNGFVLNLDAIGVDNLGRKGDQGRLDNKLKERLSNAVLMSAFNVAIAKGLDRLVPPPESSQAATQNQAVASNINSIVVQIGNDSTTNASIRISSLCTQVQNAITDKTSSSYTTFKAACDNINFSSATPDDKLKAIMNSANAAATTLVTNVATQVTPTQAQTASKQAFTDITDTLKEVIGQQQFKPTVTIDQGTPVNIYVNKDYSFPKAAVSKARLLK